MVGVAVAVVLGFALICVVLLFSFWILLLFLGFGLVTLGLCLGDSLRGLLIGSFRLVVCDLGLLGLNLERFGFDCLWLRVSWFDVGVV